MSDKLALKDKFKSGATPTQEDFQMLIDYCINNTYDDDGDFHENEYRIKKVSSGGISKVEIQLEDIENWLPYSVEVYVMGCNPGSGFSISGKTVVDGSYNNHVWLDVHEVFLKECQLNPSFSENKVIFTCLHNPENGDFEHLWKIKVMSRTDVYTIE